MFTLAKNDLKETFKRNQLCFELAWTEVRLRYTRTIIGPFWETISLGILLFTLSYLWSKLWGAQVSEYLPYLVSGMVMWRFINSMLNDGCQVYMKSDYIYRSIPLPWSVMALKHLYAGGFLFIHHFPMIIVANIIFDVNFLTLNLLYLFYTIPIIALTSYSTTIILGCLTARYRDVQSLVSSLLSVMIFFTPIFWTIDQMGEIGRKFVVMPNLIYHYIEIFRQPMLGNSPTNLNLFITFLATFTLFLISLFVLNKYKKKIIFWL
tara:strand:- start:5477 stop:6268 length:792 start_codon:yes stop_codon:yes gene_type:complete